MIPLASELSNQPAFRLEKEVRLHIGGVHASEEPVVIKTLLGSCVAVCLWDPVSAVGGMNHFMLPRGDGRGELGSRFGIHAMDRLIGAMTKLGGDRRRFIAKMFGGAHVLDVRQSENGVPQQNIAFAREFLHAEDFRVVAEDVGGHHARQLHFHTGTGRALVKRLSGASTQARLVCAERRVLAESPRYGDVTLWE